MILQKENDAHRKSLKGGAFRLNMHPKSTFDENPYRSDRPLPPAKKADSKKLDVKPFKPSSPGKQVRSLFVTTIYHLNIFFFFFFFFSYFIIFYIITLRGN